MIDIHKLYDIFKQYPKITIDSRKCPEGSIFFALKGENHDANDFAHKALENGAKYAVVDRGDVAKTEQYILVDDVLSTMQELARVHRENIKAKIIAITGTNGKTTTKELIASVLSKKYKVLYTEKNYNNHLGVPLTLLRLTDNDDFGVIEIGANHIGEIAHLASMVKPDFGLITNFGKAHLEGFGSLQGVIRAKTELFEQIKTTKGKVFINIGNEDIVEKSNGIINISYAINNNKADVSGYVTEQTPFVTLSWVSHRFFVTAQKVQTRLVGAYNAENILSSIIVGLFFEVEPQSINEALRDYIPQNHRSQYMKGDNNSLIIDTYNANASSMDIALRNFASLPFEKKSVILGDMLEMGETSEKEHKNIVELLDKLNFDKVFLVGKIFSSIKHSYITFDSYRDFITYIGKNPIKDSSILIKGSNGIGLENIIDYIK